MATTGTIQQQEVNRKRASVERALDRARDFYERVKGQLSSARKAKQTLRVIELESEEKLATDALDKAAHEFESTFGIRAPLSAEPQPKPESVAALRDANAAFRLADDEVARLERERDRLLAQIGPLTTTLEKERATFSFTSTSNPIVDAVLSEVYPDLRPNMAGPVRDQNIARLSIELADLQERFRKTEAERLEATAKRDALLEQLRTAR